jgi:hypothetical protein
MRVLWTALPGIAIIGFGFTEIFQDLFHPTHTGSLSDWVGRTVFRLLRRWPRALSSAGPLTVVLVILCWALLLAVGFALLYSAGYPGSFRLLNRENVSSRSDFATMLYFSLQVMTTLGLGDVMPKADWLRIIVSLQSLIGLGFLTAAVSSIVLIYPALGRMRMLARRTTILHKAGRQTGIEIVSDDAGPLLADLAIAVIQTRVDLIHFPVVYYFHSDHRRSSLAAALPRLLRLAEAGSSPNMADAVRISAASLRAALEDLAALLNDRFLKTGSSDPDVVFQAYARDHVIREMQPD